MTAYILTEQEHTQITEHYERLYAEIDLSEWDGKAAQLLRDTLAMLKAMKPVHVHEWFRTIEMKPTEMRCISCGTWGSTLPEESAPAAVSGWKLVPPELTHEMLGAACRARDDAAASLGRYNTNRAAYRALIAAAPTGEPG